MKYFTDAVRFLKGIKRDDEILIIFNNDGDGICSCALLMKLFEGLGLKEPYIIAQPMPMDKNIVQKIKSTFPKKIIFLDLVVDQQEDVVGVARNFADVLAVDHHQISKDLNAKNVVHFNPRFSRPKIYQSTSYCIYGICSEIADVKDNLWIAAVGMISDYNLEDSQDLVNLVRKTYGIDDLYNSFLGRIADMIAASRATKLLSCEEMVYILAKAPDARSIESLPGSEKMVQSYQIIDNEMLAIMSDARKGMEIKGNLVMYNVKSKYNLNSLASTRLSESHRDRLVLVYSKTDSRYRISARNQNKNINAGEVMKLATKGLKASGGGHEAAAGAVVNERDWEKFRERLEELVNKL